MKRTLKSLMLEKKREEMLQAGAYDGRFRPRVVKSKKKYNRKKFNNDV